MKKFILSIFAFLTLIGVFQFFQSSAETNTSSGSVCTMEYAPICGTPKLHECCSTSGADAPEYCSMVKVSCDTTPKTYSNTCMLNASGAEFLYKGECKVDTVQPTCPVYDMAAPPEGCSYKFYKDDSGCEKPKLICDNVDDVVCKNGGTRSEGWYYPSGKLYKYADCSDEEVSCPVYQEPEKKEGCTIKSYTDENNCKKYKQVCESTVCTKEYVPVCGYKEICATNMGPGEKCKEMKKTFSNKCMMNSSGYKFVSEGKCEDTSDVSCPVYKMEEPKEGCYYDYEIGSDGCKKPKLVCKGEKQCKDYSIIKLASQMNGCPLTWYVDEKGCKAHKYECKDTTDKNEKLKKRIAESIEKLFKKLESSDKSNDEKVTHLEKVASKLEELASKKSQYKDVIQYAIDMIEEYISKLSEEDFGDIFEILE